jgi:hypothetical protein
MTLVFVIKIKTNYDGVYRRLRRALKTIWRTDQLKCIAIEEIEKLETDSDKSGGSNASNAR